MSSKKFNNIIWDTTLDPIDYPELIKKKFFSIYLKNRKELVKWTGNLSENFKTEFEWWIQIPATRDQYRSILFKCIIVLEVLKDKKIKNKIKYLIVESDNFRKILILNKILDLSKTEIKIKKKSILINLCKSIFFNFIVFVSVKLANRNNKLNSSKEVNFIDTYIDHREMKNDIIYPSLEKILKGEKFNNFFFVPTFIINKKLINLMKNILFSRKRNYIMKESLISFKDFFLILFKTLFKKNLKSKFPNYNLIDYSSLINEELDSKKEFYSEFQSRLNLLFVEKLRSKNIKIKKIIIRFENQSVDKAWVLAFRRFFPKTDIIGYQGFMYYPHTSYNSPAYYEEKAKVLPNYLVVTGKIFKKPRSEFNKNIKILIGPSLNNQEILKKKIKRRYDLKFVLALSGIISLDKKMCEWIFFVLSANKNLSVIIKPHPILPLFNIIKKIPKNIKDQIFISNDKTELLLEKTEILISSGPTSIILESLIYGCKLIYLNLDPNDILIAKKILKIKKYINFVSSKQELISRINYLNKKRFIKKNNNLRNLFFTPLTKQNLEIFK